MKNNLNIIIIPDVHLKHHLVDEFLKSVTYEKIIFLGDYFDDFGDDPYQNETAAKWLKHSVYNPKRVHLIGNHDLPYMFNGKGYCCSGYDNGKNKFINGTIERADWKKLKLYHTEKINDQDWVFTHAGLTSQWITKNTDPFKLLKNEQQEFDYLFDKMLIDYNQMFVSCGRLSGGIHKRSGILWCRLKEFNPIKGINQMFGHTPTFDYDLTPVELFPGNWATDTHLNYVMSIDKQGIVTYHNINI